MNYLVNVLLLTGGVLYLFAISGALVFHNKLHRSYFWSNLFAIVGGVVLLAAALVTLLGRSVVFSALQGPYPWMTLVFGLDKLGAFFLFCLSLLTIFVSIYSMGYHHHRTQLAVVFQPVFLLGMAGLLCAQDVLSFLFFWEIMSFGSYFLIIAEVDNHEARRAGNLYLMMTQFGTSLIIIVLLGLAAYSGSPVFGLIKAKGLEPLVQSLMFIGLLLGFGTKAGMVPLHIWLPKAHPAAPTPVSALMSGFMIKAAIYGMIRFFAFFPGATWHGTMVVVLGAITALLGILYAFMENDYKRLLAYCSIENIGIILLALGVHLWGQALQNHFLANLALIGLELHILSHTLFKGLMFMSAGAVIQECQTRNLEKMGGLIKRMPQTAFFSLVGSATGAGLPFTSGFISEWLIFQALLLAGVSLLTPGLKVLAFVSIGAFAMVAGFAAATFVKLFGIGFLALPRSVPSEKAHEVSLAMRIAMGLPALGCVLMGIFPRVALNLTTVGVKLTGDLPAGPWFGLTQTGWGIGFHSNAIAPAFVLGCLALLIAVTWLILRKNQRMAMGPTWNCGTVLQPQMEYTSASFSKMVKLVFKVVLRPKRQVIKHYEKGNLFVSSLEYQSSLPSHFEERLYHPLVRFFLKIAAKIRWLQAGSIKLYLSYILIVLLLLLLYLRLV